MTETPFLALCQTRYQEINALNDLKSFYGYEKKFDSIMTDLCRQLLESNLSEVPADRRKKTLNRYGQIEIAKEYPFSNSNQSFQISPYMQDLMAYAGQSECYNECNEILSKFLSVEVSVMQVHRVTDTYGSLLEQQAAKETLKAKPFELNAGETVYAMVDGSMILTREEGWKEVKLGRIFKESGYC